MDKSSQTSSSSSSGKDKGTQTHPPATERYRNEDGSTKAVRQSDGTVTISIKKKD